MKHIIFLLLITTCTAGIAQPIRPIDYELKHIAIHDKDLGLISFYVDTVGIGRKAPVFIDINGSGGLPLCLYIKADNYTTVLNTFNPNLIDKLKEQYHYVIMDKPGTLFCDSVTEHKNLADVDMSAVRENYKASNEYTKKLSLQWRVEATKKVITYLTKNKFWDESKIIAYGYSEGGQVVPSLAVADKRITHIIPIVGCGLNQFYDGLIAWRIKAAKGELTHKQAQDSVNAYLQTIKEIYKYPEETNKMYEGHSYKRWASFCSAVPMEQLEKLNIPIYMIVGTKDENSPIYGLDYVMLDFIRLGKTNLTYDPCVGCDHWLTSNEDNKMVSHFDEYIGKIMAWLNKN
jgi:hypothetical protein